jgi:hypothetical protein
MLVLCIFAFLVVWPLPAIPITWETTAQAYKGRFSEILTLELPPNGTARPVYGFGEFDWDSSIGSAAVLMELLTYQDGGAVTILIKEGPEYIKGSDTYDGWNTTFVFLDAKGHVIKPNEGSVGYIDIPDEPFMPSSEPAPAYFTVTNSTGSTLKYLDISTTDMRAVGAHGKNLLGQTVLKPGESRDIPFSDNPDLKSIILYRYGALLQVDAKAENGQLFSLEWRPDGNSLQVEIQPKHVIRQQGERPLKVTNDGEYTLFLRCIYSSPGRTSSRTTAWKFYKGRYLQAGKASSSIYPNGRICNHSSKQMTEKSLPWKRVTRMGMPCSNIGCPTMRIWRLRSAIGIICRLNTQAGTPYCTEFTGGGRSAFPPPTNLCFYRDE